MRPTLLFEVRENCIDSGLLAHREDVSPLTLARSHPGNPPLRGQRDHPSLRPNFGGSQRVFRDSWSPGVRRGRRTRAAHGCPELPPSRSRGQGTRGRALPLTHPGRSLRAEFPVRWGEHLWGSRCFSEPGITSRVWARAWNDPSRQRFRAKGGWRLQGNRSEFGQGVRRRRRQLHTGTLASKPRLFPAFHLFFEKRNNSPGYQIACFNFRRGFINPELFGTSGFSKCGLPKPEGRAGGSRRGAGMLCRLHPEPGGHRAAASPARGGKRGVGSVQGWAEGRGRVRARAGPVVHVHVFISNRQSEAEKRQSSPRPGLVSPG